MFPVSPTMGTPMWAVYSAIPNEQTQKSVLKLYGLFTQPVLSEKSFLPTFLGAQYEKFS